jgi:ribosomal protein S27AE
LLAQGGLVPGLIHTHRDEQPTTADDPPSKKRFCSRCGEPVVDPPAGEAPPAFEQRVCGTCGMGVLLRCSPAALPGTGSAFVIVTRTLEVGAVSEAAEAIFGPEEKVLGKGLLDLMCSPVGDRKLGRAVSQAALRLHDPLTLPTRLTGERADAIGTMACRISTCGPPRAALVCVEPTHFGRR